MQENYLYYIWNMRLFDHQNLQTTDGQTIQILDVGKRNLQDGPDFFNAKIKIDQTTWAGNVEMHLKASDWWKHQHQHNQAYNNIILHVVYEADAKILDAQKQAIPTLELRQRISPSLHKKYLYLLSAQTWIPCEKLIQQVDAFSWIGWLDRLMIERLEQKTQPILQSLSQNRNSWEATFYQSLARAFGANTNADAFELLAKSLTINILAKHRDQLFQLEALLFGQAGLLQKTFVDAYPQQLQKEYAFLQKKWQLQPLQASSWKFARLRPPNFPTIRIAQLAQLIHQSTSLFSKILTAQETKDYEKLLSVEVSDYWKTHFVFDKISGKRPKRVGKTMIKSLLINTIVPILFVYGQQRGEPDYVDKAIKLLQSLPKEKNNVIKKWEALSLSLPIKTAFDSQALLQLKKNYCTTKKCLQCVVGNKVLRAKSVNKCQEMKKML